MHLNSVLKFLYVPSLSVTFMIDFNFLAVKAERQKVKDAQAAEVAFAELDVNQDKM